MDKDTIKYSLIVITIFILFISSIIGTILGLYYHNGNIFFPSIIILLFLSEVYQNEIEGYKYLD